MRTRLISLLPIALAAILGSPRLSAAEWPVRTTTQAAVTVSAVPQTFSPTQWAFELVFDTHSGALNDDLLKTSTLTTDNGKTLLPLQWQGDAPGGHHRKGLLQFKPGSPLPGAIELRITREGEAKPRLFQWQLK